MQRSELRDLVDVRELIARGGDLQRALTDAPRKDTGFSPMTLAWLLKGLPIEALAAGQGWPRERIAELERFRQDLLDQLAELTRPDES